MSQPEWESASNASGSMTPLPWARQTAAAEQRVTTRARKMVEGLPGWEPLPPGEIVVRRPSLS